MPILPPGLTGSHRFPEPPATVPSPPDPGAFGRKGAEGMKKKFPAINQFLQSFDARTRVDRTGLGREHDPVGSRSRWSGGLWLKPKLLSFRQSGLGFSPNVADRLA